MFDESYFEVECDNECGAGPPPIFNLPPPPRPDFMQELSTCSENSLSDYEMCEAIPVSIFFFVLNFIWEHDHDKNKLIILGNTFKHAKEEIMSSIFLVYLMKASTI